MIDYVQQDGDLADRENNERDILMGGTIWG